jgi:DUF4097 and DUF4098 domain-containing protein YvlB
MTKYFACILAIVVWMGLGVSVLAQDPGIDRVTVPLSDPSRPGTVKVHLIAGGITVKGYAGKEVIVESKNRGEERSHGQSRAETAGMKRIPNTSTSLTVEEENNVVSIGAGPSDRPVDITLQVPARTSLRLKTINDGDIRVEQVQGEIEVNNINGAVTLSQVSGSVVAHALNGNVKVNLVTIEANKPMSFTSMNGDIDVSFPPDLKASVSLKSDQGEIYSDFDIRMDLSTQKPEVEGTPGKGGKYRIKMDRIMRGTINGGGPEMQFKTFNGDIFIRKAAK